ncbi:MAG: Methyltransferase type 11 [Candidatus Beckwithbacteria bacterium GW2011_GWA2_43_10]|uniref:Methyltransferase type 11 n=1 Tax=Candidatus Beckwithbacteria bacterium GW2011_GWA2_43_10 TaxID=1618369 RepID=A0A0G1EBK3_9BACT|nr:MAG: Methyltransferase type 11 [Candidatus Beckwithbacteria bacterium GW2011_GWA2_43_10]
MLKTMFRKIVRKRSETVVNRIMPYIRNSNKIIDIGSGMGDVAGLIKAQGKNITPVDVAGFHGPRMIKTIIYDGKTLPFKNKSFDTALLLTVMHHTPDPEMVFKEATRVAKEIVVIETSYTTPLNRFLTIISDTIGNLRLEAFWGSYKTDKQWKKFFNDHGFIVKESRKFNDKNLGIIPFLHILYYLRRK